MNDESLWPIVKRVDAPNDERRRVRVESKTTRLCIEGGMMQLKRAFREPLIKIGELPDCRIRRMLSFGTVAKTINREWPGQKFTSKTFETRWGAPSDYFADLLSFALYKRHWALRKARDPKMLEELKTATDMAAVIRKITRSIQQTAHSDELHRLPLLLANYADADEEIAEALRETRELVLDEWCQVYAEMFEAHGVRLRADLPIRDFALLLHAADSGSAMLTMAGGDRGDMSDSPMNSLFGKCALVYFAGALDPGDGSTIDSTVNWKFRKGSQGGSSLCAE